MTNVHVHVPNYLTPLDALTTAVEVVGDVREKVDNQGKHRISPAFGSAGWVIPVEAIRGVRQKNLPGGGVADVLDVERINVTVWGTKPAASVGDFVKLVQPMVGAVEGNIFVQALGVTDFDEDALTAALGEE